MIIGFLISVAISVLTIQLVFNRLEQDQSRHIATFLTSLLRNESSMSQSYGISQSLEDMQMNGAIYCARLAKSDRLEKAIFYDSTYKAECPLNRLTKIEMKGLDGHSWSLEVAPVLSFSFYLIKWSAMAISVALFALAFKVLKNVFERDRRRIEAADTRRLFLEHLNEQVRHDVASPISALRIIAERAPLDPDTRTFLKEAVSRTSGVFQALTEGIGKTESFDVVRAIRMVVQEKKVSRSAFPITTVKGDECQLLINKTEFCRMISNLLDNSHEAEATSIEVTVIRGPYNIQLVLADNGKPIPEEVMVKIGERGNTVGKVQGTGLGLYHGHRFMKSIGGRFVVSTRGPKFTLDFPDMVIAR